MFIDSAVLYVAVYQSRKLGKDALMGEARLRLSEHDLKIDADPLRLDVPIISAKYLFL